MQLRICAGVITGETSRSKILDLQGGDIREIFSEIETGILGAIDFLNRYLDVKHFKILPFPGILVHLSCFFATDKVDGRNYTVKQKEVITQWFWRSVFSRRFSSDVNERQGNDIGEMRALQKDENYKFRLPKPEVKIDFEKGNFAAGNANSKSLDILLNSMGPHSFLSGAKIDTSKVIKKGSKHEFNHVYPQAYLEKHGVCRREINVLANICFLTRSDNNSINDKPPSDYLVKLSNETKTQYLFEALCPENIETLPFGTFCSLRAAMLNKKAEELMGKSAS